MTYLLLEQVYTFSDLELKELKDFKATGPPLVEMLVPLGLTPNYRQRQTEKQLPVILPADSYVHCTRDHPAFQLDF